MSVEELLAGFGLTLALIQPSLADETVPWPQGGTIDDSLAIQTTIDKACTEASGNVPINVIFHTGTYNVNEGLTIPGGFFPPAGGSVVLCPLNIQGTGTVTTSGSITTTTTTLNIASLPPSAMSLPPPSNAQAFTINSPSNTGTYTDTVGTTTYIFAKSTVGAPPTSPIDSITISGLTFDGSSSAAQMNSEPVIYVGAPVNPLSITNSAINNIPFGSGINMLGWQGTGQGPENVVSSSTVTSPAIYNNGTPTNSSIYFDSRSTHLHNGAFCVTVVACDPDMSIVSGAIGTINTGGTLTMSKPLDDTIAVGTTLYFTEAFTVAQDDSPGHTYICADTTVGLSTGQTIFYNKRGVTSPTYITNLPTTNKCANGIEVDLSTNITQLIPSGQYIASAAGFYNPTINVYETNIGLSNPNGANITCNGSVKCSGKGFGIYATHGAYWANNGGTITLNSEYTFGSSIFMENWENGNISGYFALNNQDGNPLAQFHNQNVAGSACIYMKGTYQQTVGGIVGAPLVCFGATGQGFETTHNVGLTMAHVSIHGTGDAGIGVGSGDSNTVYDATLWDNGQPVTNGVNGGTAMLPYGLALRPYNLAPNGFQTNINAQWVCVYDDAPMGQPNVTQSAGIGTDMSHPNNTGSALAGILGGKNGTTESIQGRHSGTLVALILPQVSTFGLNESGAPPTLAKPSGWTCPYNDPH